jgi:hypothetical protein
VALIRLKNVSAQTLQAALHLARRDVPCFYFSELDPATAFAGLGLDSEVICGIWLRETEGYPAALMARDVKTLCALSRLRDVVIEGEHAKEMAEVIVAMLNDEPVTMTNSVASLDGALNRPAPTKMPTIWWSDRGLLRCKTTTLHSGRWRRHPEDDALRFN